MKRLRFPAVLAAFAIAVFFIVGCGGGSDTDPGVAAWVFGQGNTLGFIRGTVYDENSLTGVSARVLANDIGVPTFQDGRYVIDPTPCNGRVLMSAGSGRHRARSVEIDSADVNLYLEPQPENPTGLVTVNVTVHGAQVQNVAVYVGWNTPDTPDGTVQVVAGRAVGLVRVEPNRSYTVAAWAPGKVMDFITDLEVREGVPVEVDLDLVDATSTNSGSIDPRGFPTNATVGAIAIGVGNVVDVVSSTLRDVGSRTTFDGLPPGTYWVWAAVDSTQAVFRSEQEGAGAARRMYEYMRNPHSPSRLGVGGTSSSYARAVNVLVTAGHTSVVNLSFPTFIPPPRLWSPRPNSMFSDRTPKFDWDLVPVANVYAVNVDPDEQFKDLYLGWTGFTPFSRLTYPPLPEAELRPQVSYFWWVDAFRIPGFHGADAADLNFLELFSRLDNWASSYANGFFID